jgi:5-methylcytosine-specific restriction endonuclease McrA
MGKKESEAKWRLAHSEERKAYRAAWYASNHKKVRASQTVWRIANPEKARAATVAWRAANPERLLAYQVNRRARKLNAFVEAVNRQAVFERDEGLCGICQEAVDPQNWHLDHIIPLSKGGEHSYANVQVTHPRCNQRKGAAIDRYQRL